jgi:hypothetical protein
MGTLWLELPLQVTYHERRCNVKRLLQIRAATQHPGRFPAMWKQDMKLADHHHVTMKKKFQARFSASTSNLGLINAYDHRCPSLEQGGSTPAETAVDP